MAERLYYAKAGPIDPVALVNEVVAVFIKESWKAYEVTYFEPLQRSAPLVFDQGAIAAGGTTGDVQLVNLAQTDDPPEMAQLRFYPIDDVEVTFKVGQAGARFTTLMRTTTADRFTVLVDPDYHTTEVIVLRNWRIFVNCANPTGYALTMSRVAFFGYRFKMNYLEVQEKDPKAVKSHPTLKGRSIVFVASS